MVGADSTCHPIVFLINFGRDAENPQNMVRMPRILLMENKILKSKITIFSPVT